ncbi:MAG: thioredoxin domain-containing protein [Anaerolineae bacterium]
MSQSASSGKHPHTNRLIHETSPYLLQHAHNPVDWYPWGDEAFERARAEDKPVLLSVGYSSCHWCHVMERESFEDPTTAEIMNEFFVSIKVDREERPDVDAIYMDAVQAMSGHGGWPMTVFLTPNGVPFYGGTYFPPTDRHGLPGFPRLLHGVAQAWQSQREGLLEQGKQVLAALDKSHLTAPSRLGLDETVLEQAFRTLGRGFDPRNGGLGTAPKFPQAMTWEFMLRMWGRTQASEAAYMTQTTLQRMADGGIYDHLGGGFHRYSVDAEWLVPHFEKMLYDNALLARLYLHGYQAFGNEQYRHVIVETLEYVRRDMMNPEGGFYSAEDADSEGEEGKFYVWSLDEVQRLLGPDADAFARYYDITRQGNFEGHNILHVTRDVATAAREFGMSEASLADLLARGRATLFQARSKRVRPGLDDKVLTSWNALMLAAFAEAAAVLGDSVYRDIAVRNADFLLNQVQSNGRLLHTWKGGEAKTLGFLDDYAYLADALLVLYEATFDLRWVTEARRLTDAMIDLFWHEDEGVFYQTARDQSDLITRPIELFDNATPSGVSAATSVLLRLAHLLGEPDYQRYAVSVLQRVRDLLVRAPAAFGHMLGALDNYLSAPKEVAIVGAPDSSATQALLQVVFGRYRPNSLVALRAPTDPEPMLLIPILADRDTVDGQATAYVCENYACQMPTTNPDTLARQLE